MAVSFIRTGGSAYLGLLRDARSVERYEPDLGNDWLRDLEREVRRTEAFIMVMRAPLLMEVAGRMFAPRSRSQGSVLISRKVSTIAQDRP